MGCVEFESFPGFRKSGKRLNVVPAAEVVAVTKEDRRSKRWIVIEIVVGRGQAVKRVGVNFVQHLRSVDADKHNLIASFEGHLGIGRKRYIDHAAPVVATLTPSGDT